MHEYNEVGGKIVTIKGYGASVSQQVFITIISDDGEIIEDLSIFSTKEGDFSIIWVADKEVLPGTYTVTAEDPIDTAETTVVI